MKKARNFIGAVAIALAFTLGPAPAESAVEAPSLVDCFLIINPSIIFSVPQGVAELLETLEIADCNLGGTVGG